MTNIPSYQGSSGMPQRPSGQGAPPTVMMAVRFMYAGAILSAITLLIGLVTSSDLRSVFHKAYPHYTSAHLTSLVHEQEVSIVIGGLITIGLWIWMSIVNQRGHNWARITGTVFFGLSTIDLIVGVTLHETVASTVVTVIVWAVGLGAVIYLWRPESTAYFKAPKYLS